LPRADLLVELGLWRRMTRSTPAQLAVKWLPRLPPTCVDGRADATTNSNGTDDPMTAQSTA